ILGWRAPLAILLGVTLQAVLIPHGGLSTIGVNTCTEALPALLTWWAFAVIRRAPWARQPWFRAGLVALSAIIWTGSLVFGAVVLATNTLGDFVSLRGQAGLMLSVLEDGPAFAVL